LKEYLYALIHSIIIYNNQKVETTQKSINKWVSKQNVFIYTVEYCSVLKGKEFFIHATPWMSIKDIILSEKVSHKKTNCIWSPMWGN
jgi:hypothetical protein